MPDLPQHLTDCFEHGADSGSELFVVEGESGAKAVCRVRTPQTQAVLPMQGKPLNAAKATQNEIRNNPHLAGLIGTLDVDISEPAAIAKLRYQRIILVMDPDADGIHCGALMLLFFYQCLRPILEAGYLYAAHPPTWEITSPALPEPVYSRTTKHYHQVLEALKEQGADDLTTKKFRGLGSMDDHVISKLCVAPETRKLSRLRTEDAKAVLRAFASMRPERGNRSLQ